MFRRTALLGLACGVLLVSACGGDPEQSSPTPFTDSGPGESASSTPPTTPSGTPTGPTTPPRTTAAPTKPPAKKLVVVTLGRFANNPAARGLEAGYQLHYRAQATFDPNLLKGKVSVPWLADYEGPIRSAKLEGWVMRPPGRLTVKAVRPGQNSLIEVDVCLGQTMSWFDNRKKTWVQKIGPKGLPATIHMAGSGANWKLYRAFKGKFTC